ncbi:uncharacterized protein EDB91DRAFT_589266 [Suillus paluster]|uniref:uncharacterized protein n=1 Tax=Suillus paluster TaxID=48578 RepID=UPI001B8776BC|nr:uncharacterized protein EDB91DRAFT_589266 [Suillus paluster]KAG1734444.1 hypothetical protein EDB91DRAFT_589266 [Suillus paluster]
MQCGQLTCTVTASSPLRSNLHKFPLSLYIEQFYSGHILNSTVRLDLPAFNALGSDILQDLGFESFPCVAWETVSLITSLIRLFSAFCSDCSQQDGTLFVVLNFLQSISYWYGTGELAVGSFVWTATTSNEDYIRMRGLNSLVVGFDHRQELVAGNSSESIGAV